MRLLDTLLFNLLAIEGVIEVDQGWIDFSRLGQTREMATLCSSAATAKDLKTLKRSHKRS